MSRRIADASASMRRNPPTKSGRTPFGRPPVAAQTSRDTKISTPRFFGTLGPSKKLLRTGG
eukprot:4614734-Pyramimonas_sp.AAC.1